MRSPNFLLYIYFFCFTFTTLSYVSLSSPFNNTSVIHFCHDEERVALLSFKESFTFQQPSSDYTANATRSWKKGTDCCEWEGIQCHPFTHHVVLLDLSSNGINTIIPSNSSLFHLYHLQSIDLSKNHFYSTISPKFGQFRFLKHLDLSYNSFNGGVPLEFIQLSQLTFLDLSFNYGLKMSDFNRIIGNMSELKVLNLSAMELNSNFPKFISNFSSLTSIIFRDCKLTGVLPTSILNLPNLKEISVGYNDGITFNFPSSLNWSRKLELLDLSDVNISSSIPNSPGQLSNLATLRLRNCSLYGTVPTWVWNVSHSINLGDNNLSGGINLYNILTNLPMLKSLLLSESGLSVTIKEGPSPTNFTTMLSSSLDILELKHTNIHGELPEWFQHVGRDSLERLDISNNALTGGLEKLPWSKLGHLNIASNLLQGDLPVPLASAFSLFDFLASNNYYSGPINPSLCKLINIVILDLSNNNLSGEYPKCLGNFSNKLLVLNIGSNNIRGTLPEKFSYCNSLEYLDLSSNSLNGLLPKCLTECKKLKVLNVARNKFGGDFPKWLHSLLELEVLDLSSNSFQGHIIIDITGNFSLSKLRILDISNNNFCGKIPSAFIRILKAMMNSTRQYGNPQYMREYRYTYYYSIILTYKRVEKKFVKIISSLSYMDLSSNAFQGDIPECIGELISIYGLNLSHNYFTGPIPASIGKLLALESLDLSSNRLTGKIPQELTNLPGLEIFNVSQNQLEGHIPQGRNFDTFLADSYGGNLGLCGQPLPNCGGNPKPFNLGDGYGSILLEWEVVLMGFGSGVVIGLAWGYYMFSVGKPFCFIILANKMEMVILDFCNEHFGRHARKTKMTRK